MIAGGPHPGSLSAVTAHEPETVRPEIVGNGLNYQAVECGRCLREGLTEHDLMPLDESLAIMRLMDGLRLEWGLRYPME